MKSQAFGELPAFPLRAPHCTLLPWYKNTLWAQGAARSFALVVGHFALATTHLFTSRYAEIE